VREKSTARRTREGIVFEEGNIKRAADAVLRVLGRDHYTPAARPPCVAHPSACTYTNQPVGRVPRADQRETERDLFFSNNRAQHKPSGTHRQKHLITHACSLTRSRTHTLCHIMYTYICANCAVVDEFQCAKSANCAYNLMAHQRVEMRFFLT